MRSFYAAIALAVITLIGGAGYLSLETRRLDRFCGEVPIGASIAQVRKAAQKVGFEPQIESFSQLRILPRYWHSAPPSCRVFFNRDQAVQFRHIQAS